MRAYCAVRSVQAYCQGNDFALWRFIEVFMSTPLEICEQRDRKGIYAKARAGIMKGVTGIDAPYETPQSPELSIDTTQLTPTEAAQEVFLFLEEQGYIR